MEQWLDEHCVWCGNSCTEAKCMCPDDAGNCPESAFPDHAIYVMAREQDRKMAALVEALEAITHGPSGEAGRTAETLLEMAKACMSEAQRIARAALAAVKGEPR